MINANQQNWGRLFDGSMLQLRVLPSSQLPGLLWRVVSGQSANTIVHVSY